MGITKIYDFAWMAVLVGVIVITMGYGLQSAITYGNVSDTTSFFSDVGGNTTSRLKSASDDQETIISGQEGSGDSATSDGYLLGGLKSLFSLGNTWTAIRDAFSQGASMLGIPAIYITLVFSALLITFAAILYTWFRGNG